jgi:phage terminase large subunit-like protein
MKFTAEQYALDVISGKIPACKQVISACKRHQNDLQHGHKRGLYFDEDAAKVAIAFFSVLKHWKGEWAGQFIELEPFQQFQIWNIFGWKRADGTRRFRTVYIEEPRKNGKTTIAAGAGIYLAFVDGEPGAEVYTAATKRDQARIAHNDATKMVKSSPQLKKIITPFKDNLHNKQDGSKFEPLGRDSDSMDGLNVHGAICDEVHAWKDRLMWDLLDTATGSRRQPLIFAITTAGFDRQSLCYQLHDYAEKVAYGIVEDDSFFGLIYTIDEGDDWEDEATWFKANPNLGVSKKLDDMRRLAERAKEMPAALNSFLRLHLNVWTQSSERWISPEHWEACNIAPIEEKYLAGRDCWAAVDLSSRGDITAVVYEFPGDSYSDVVCRFFIPEDGMRLRSKRDRVPYETWVRQGFITATPGDRIDYDYILAQIEQDMSVFNVREIAFDPWNATHVTTKLLEQDAPVIEFRQGYVSMNPAMGALDVALSTKKINHGGNPVLTWMADNIVAAMDPAGNMKPDKGKSTEKIDGIVALIMAHYRATLANGKQESVYNRRGIRSL